MKSTRHILAFTLVLAAGFLAVRVGFAGVPPSAAIQEEEARKWDFSLSAFGYIVPDDSDYVQPTLTADRDWFHFEARYNYEGLETGSAWLGYNLSAGEEWQLEFTPMIGAVFGETRGVAPGFELSLDWRKFALYAESEYVIDTSSHPENFLYTWIELTYAPCDWFRAGLVAQRTRISESGLDVDRGLLVGVSWRDLEFTACLFNLGWQQPMVVLGVTVSF